MDDALYKGKKMWVQEQKTTHKLMVGFEWLYSRMVKDNLDCLQTTDSTVVSIPRVNEILF